MHKIMFVRHLFPLRGENARSHHKPGERSDGDGGHADSELDGLSFRFRERTVAGSAVVVFVS